MQSRLNSGLVNVHPTGFGSGLMYSVEKLKPGKRSSESYATGDFSIRKVEDAEKVSARYLVKGPHEPPTLIVGFYSAESRFPYLALYDPGIKGLVGKVREDKTFEEGRGLKDDRGDFTHMIDLSRKFSRGFNGDIKNLEPASEREYYHDKLLSGVKELTDYLKTDSRQNLKETKRL